MTMHKVRCLVTGADVREGAVYQVFESIFRGVKVIDDVGDQYMLMLGEYEDVPECTPLGLTDIRTTNEQLKELLKAGLSIRIDRDRGHHGDSYDVELLFEGEVISTSSVTIDESKL